MVLALDVVPVELSVVAFGAWPAEKAGIFPPVIFWTIFCMMFCKAPVN